MLSSSLVSVVVMAAAGALSSCVFRFFDPLVAADDCSAVVVAEGGGGVFDSFCFCFFEEAAWPFSIFFCVAVGTEGVGLESSTPATEMK